MIMNLGKKHNTFNIVLLNVLRLSLKRCHYLAMTVKCFECNEPKNLFDSASPS